MSRFSELFAEPYNPRKVTYHKVGIHRLRNEVRRTRVFLQRQRGFVTPRRSRGRIGDGRMRFPCRYEGDSPTGSTVTAGTKRMSPHVPGTSASAVGEEGKGVDILTRTVDFEQERTRRVTASLYDRTRKRWQKFGRGGQTDTRLWKTASGAFSANGHRGRAHTLRRGPNSWTTFCHLCEPPPPR